MMRFLVALFLSALVTTPVVVCAQKLVPQDGVHERYTDRPSTSGFLLVGLAYGSINGTFDANNLSLNIPASIQSGALCFRLVSRDGRYRGLASYSPPSPLPTFKFLQFGTRFSPQLRELHLTDLAPRMIVASDCQEDSGGLVIPVSLTGERSEKQLMALINPGEARVSARIVDLKGRLSTPDWSPCELASEGANVAFSQICSLKISENATPGPATLELAIVELLNGRSIEKFSIQLAPR